jgi:hypothetical protein
LTLVRIILVPFSHPSVHIRIYVHIRIICPYKDYMSLLGYKLYLAYILCNKVDQVLIDISWVLHFLRPPNLSAVDTQVQE